MVKDNNVMSKLNKFSKSSAKSVVYQSDLVTHKVTPNHRLLTQISNKFRELGIDHWRETTHIGCGKQRAIFWKENSYDLPYILYTPSLVGTACQTPFGQIPRSYLAVTRYDTTSMNRQFICQSPEECIEKLYGYGLLDLDD